MRTNFLRSQMALKIPIDNIFSKIPVFSRNVSLNLKVNEVYLPYDCYAITVLL